MAIGRSRGSWSARRLAASLAFGALLAATGCSGGDEATPATTTSTEVPVTTTTTEAPIEAGTVRYVYSAEVGDCFDRRRLADEGDRAVILLLDCSLPHEQEVFFLVTIDDELLAAVSPDPAAPATDSGPWPGDELLGSAARLACPRPFDEWAGIAYERSSLEIAWLAPDDETWADGRRTIACTVTDGTGERMAGSKAGAGV
jgi:hypothetical protein